MEFTIDAQGKTVGRIATQAAHILMGKNHPSFERHVLPQNRVRVINAGQASITDKKKGETTFRSYTGARGGLKEMTMEVMIEKTGVASVLERAIHGMIPNNKLKKEILKHLTVSE